MKCSENVERVIHMIINNWPGSIKQGKKININNLPGLIKNEKNKYRGRYERVKIKNIINFNLDRSCLAPNHSSQ